MAEGAGLITGYCCLYYRVGDDFAPDMRSCLLNQKFQVRKQNNTFTIFLYRLSVVFIIVDVKLLCSTQTISRPTQQGTYPFYL